MDTKQEILSRLYSLRAGISVISQKADAIEDMNAKKEKRKKLSKDMILSAEKDINRKKGYMSDSKSYIASYKKNIKECEDDIAFGNSRKKEFERLKSENQK